MNSVAAPAYSTASLMLVGLLISTAIIAAFISLLYWINTRIRRGMKASKDDWRVEKDIEAGHTLHAEGIYGHRHPDEEGEHLKQEDPHPTTAAFKPGLVKNPPKTEPNVDLPPASGEPRKVY